MQTTKPAKKRQGFAAMSSEKRRRIASMGGKKAHDLGKAHRWTTEEAGVAGRKGGRAGRGTPKARKGNSETTH